MRVAGVGGEGRGAVKVRIVASRDGLSASDRAWYAWMPGLVRGRSDVTGMRWEMRWSKDEGAGVGDGAGRGRRCRS